MRKRNSKRSLLNYHKHKGAANAEFDFDSRKYATDVNFLKTLSFSRDYVIPAAVKKGELISLTESFRTPYDALRKTGVAFMANSLNMKGHEVTLLKEYSTRVNDQFKPLFVNLSVNNNHIFKRAKGHKGKL